MAELPSGTVTFLFTDLEGSTRLWEEHPEAMQAALARHDEILRERGRRPAAGHVVKTTGDGIHAVFATAHDALDAAVAVQRGLGGGVVRRDGSVAGADGGAHRRGGAPRRRLLRQRGEPRGAADERRARRSDRGVGGDERAGARRVGRARRSGRASAARPGERGAGVPGARAGPARGVPAVAVAGRVAGQPAACRSTIVRRPRGRARRASRSWCAEHRGGDPDRAWAVSARRGLRCRSRRRSSPSSRTVRGCVSSRRSPIRTRCGRRWRATLRVQALPGPEPRGVGARVSGGEATAARARQL